MAAVNLPDSPANGTTETVGGITYTYDSSKGYWTAASSGGGGGGGGGASVSTSDAAPGSPSDGDLWYDTDDGGMFVYYQDTDSSQWVEVIGSAGSDGAAGAAGADGSATVVANTTALLAISSPSAGDQVYVTANNTLYFYNGSGWYKIALINTNPTISGVSSSYVLASDGTATTVTITASDPEGIPITYSIASDTSGNTATVAQGTGASTNVFTVTPSTNSAHAGSFSLTFRASDGVNFATAPATFTLQFSVVNSKYTTALITSVGANNATNSSFDDKSTSNHTITAGGDAHQTTFSPYRHGGYSTYFDGSGDKIEFLQTTAIGTSDFTIEAWVYPKSFGTNEAIFCTRPSGSSTSLQLNVNGSGDLQFWYKGVSNSDRVSISSVFTADTWHHIAIVGDGTANEIKIYKNGTQIGTTISYDYNYSASDIYRLGNNRGGTAYYHGYLRDVRVVHSKVYTANFTAPTDPLTAITNTKLLTCHLPYIVDGSSDANASTISGDTHTLPFAPYDAQEYSATDNLGSMYFDGSGDYLQVSSLSGNFIAEGSWTQEMWIRLAGTGTGQQIGPSFGGGAGAWNSSNGHQFLVFTHSSGFLVQYYGTNNSHNTITLPSVSTLFKPNTWHHWAISWDGTTLRFFVDGTSVHTTTTFTPNTMTGTHTELGRQPDNSYYSDGHLTDVRIVAGTAVYTSNFTPPTAPLTAITNTSLLLQGTDAGIIDKAQGAKTVKLIGDAKSSTTQTKFLSSAMYFDGNGDGINLDGQDLANFGTAPFTIEGWLYLIAYPSQWNFTVDTRGGSNASDGFCLEITPSDFGIYAGENMCRSGNAFGLGAWKHWAYTRDTSGNHKFFVNGTQSGSTFTGSKNYTVNNLKIGYGDSQYQNAYMSDIRITKGLARYTSNFTAPTAALQG